MRQSKSDEFMTAFALDYLKRMGWDKTQLIIIRHDDHDYDHIHMALNVIGDDRKPLDMKFRETLYVRPEEGKLTERLSDVRALSLIMVMTSQQVSQRSLTRTL